MLSAIVDYSSSKTVEINGVDIIILIEYGLR
jgi:hypothetical protein